MGNGSILPWREDAAQSEHSKLPSTKFRVGGFQVDPLRLVVRNGMGSSHVERKVMEVLVCLANRAPETVTREQLFDEAWRGAYVSDGVLNRVISILRKALGDDPRAPHYIETIPRVGYRLLLPVEWEEVAEPARAANTRGLRWLWPGVAAALLILATSVGFLLKAPAPGLAAEVRPLTADPGWEFMPALSSDGRWLAYVGLDAANEGGIYVVDSQGGTTPRLIVHADAEVGTYRPTWSPDGTRLAWHETGDDDTCRIRIQSLLADAPERTFECASSSSLDWSPDGRWLLVSQGDAANLELPVLELDIKSGESRVPIEHPEGYLDQEARYSPSGEHIALIRIQLGVSSTVQVFDRSGRKVHDVATADGEAQGLDWLSEDELVLNLNDAGGTPELYLYSLESQRLTRLPETADARFPAVGPGGIAFSRMTPRSRIMEADLTANEPAFEVRTESTGKDGFPGLAPDGQALAYVSNRSGRLQVWLEERDQGPVQVTDVETNWIGPPRWRPDGSQFLFEVRSSDGFTTYRYDLEVSRVESVHIPLTTPRDPVWGPDGEIVVTAFDQDQWQLWSDSGSGDWVRLTEQGGLVAGFAPDGETIYYTKFNQPGLWRNTWPLAEEHLFVPWLAYNDRRHWAAIEGGVVARRNTGGEDVDLVGVMTDGSSSVLKALTGVYTRGISASATSVAYAETEIIGADVYLLELSR